MQDITNRADYSSRTIGMGCTFNRTYEAVNEKARDIQKAIAERDKRLGIHSGDSVSNYLTAKEKQELARLFVKNVNEAIHILSEKQGRNDGSPEKIALHSFFIGIKGELSGDGFMSGALAGGVNEAAVAKLMKTLRPNNPDLVQMAGAALGYATNKLAGEDALAGAALAQWGTRWNLTLENPELMVTMGFAYIVANSILHINGTVLAVQDATGEWIKTAEANAYIRMIEEIRDCNGDVIYDFPEDPQDFIPEGLAKKNIQILEIPICILVIGFQMQMGKLKENSYVVGYKKMKINDEITYDVKNYCIIYNFDESGIIKSYTISKPTENEKDRIYEFFNGFHDWFLKQINFDNDSKALCIEIISDDRSQTICELRCEGVTNMMLPVESPWNTRTLYINMAFIEGDSLGIELLTGDMWKIKASRYVFKTTTLSEREAVAMPKYYPGEKIPNANGEG